VSSGGTIKQIGVGVWRSDDGTTDEFGTRAYKMALPFIAKRAPTSGELTSLAGGAHPLAVFGSALLDYWPPNSKTSAINGWVLSDVGGTITIDTGDNPTVDDPPSSRIIPNADVSVTGWTTTPSGTVSSVIDEATADDADYATSPAITGTGQPAILGLTNAPLAAGDWAPRIRANVTAGTATMRLSLVNSSNVSQGSVDVTVNTTITTYNPRITTTGDAHRLKVEFFSA
jgi:hypothetical protein